MVLKASHHGHRLLCLKKELSHRVYTISYSRWIAIKWPHVVILILWAESVRKPLMCMISLAACNEGSRLLICPDISCRWCHIHNHKIWSPVIKQELRIYGWTLRQWESLLPNYRWRWHQLILFTDLPGDEAPLTTALTVWDAVDLWVWFGSDTQ